MSMFHTISCRLCINICHDHRRLYDEDGCSTEVHALAEKYFASLLENREGSDRDAVICTGCWHHIYEFHTFQQSVFLAQKKFVCRKGTAELNSDTAKRSRELNSQASEEFISATSSNFSRDHHDQQSAIITKSEVDDRLYDGANNSCSQVMVKSELVDSLSDQEDNDSCLDNDNDNEEYQCQDVVKSEVNVMEYTVTDVTYDPAVLIKNNVSGDEGSDELDDPDGVGGGSVADFSDSGDEMLLAEPKTRLDNLEEDRKQPQSSCDSDLFPHEQKEELDDDSDWCGENSSSNDELSLADQSNTNNLTTEPADGHPHRSKAKPKNKRHKTNSKPPQTVQEYDDLIARWRPNLECEICHESCASYSLLQQHFEEQHRNGKCHIMCCQFKLYQRCEIEKHIRFHTEPNAIKCEACFTVYDTRYGYLTHMRRKHPRKTKDAAATEPQQPLPPKADDTKDNREHICQQCGKGYRALSSLRRHQKMFHVEPSQIVTLKCDICDKVYSSSRSLREHVATHAGKPMLTCRYCPNTFKFSTTLHVHVMKKHSKEWQEKRAELKRPKVLKCSKCNKVYQERRALREHQAAKHDGIDLYTCTYCPKTFSYRTNWQVHEKNQHAEEVQKKAMEKGVKKD